MFIILSVFSLVLLIIVTTVFLAAQLKSDNSIMDIVYGPIFFVSGLATLLLVGDFPPLTLLILGATFLWSARLGWRIYRKNRGAPEDARYAAWRSAWSQRGQVYFIVRSYLQINLLQGVVIGLVSLPFIISLSQPAIALSLINYLFAGLGMLVFLIGLTIESLADKQLDAFIARKKAGTEPAVIMKTGLFRYSRRPNYFGETLIWWGLALIVLPLPFGYLALLSPIIITYIVTRVTGPMLEQIFLTKYPEEYQAYMTETNYFIPGRPKLP